MLAFYAIFVFSNIVAKCDDFEEELLVKDVGNGYSVIHFNFVTRKPISTSGSHHFHIFPKDLYQTVDTYRINEFHLSLVQGFWDRLKWGPQFVPSVAGGAEVWAWFDPTEVNVDKSWAYFLEALSGQFCASLSHLGNTKNFISPIWSHRPAGLSESYTSLNVSKSFRYAQLPNEGVCTENLTPWSKLLPCKKLAGLASMVKPKSIYKASYNALHVDLRRICSTLSCESHSLELRQSLTLVFDRRHLYRSIYDEWSLAGLLGEKISSACPVASRSEIIILKSIPELKLSPKPPSGGYNLENRNIIAVYPWPHGSANDVVISSSKTHVTSQTASLQGGGFEGGVGIMKYLTGKGDVDGGVVIEVKNRLSKEVKLVLLDSMPWYTEVYFSSLVFVLHTEGSQEKVHFKADKLRFQPGVHRKRMAYLEALLRVPSGATVYVSYTFKKVLMRWNEYPPDANHGVYMPSASIVYKLEAPVGGSSQEIALPMWASTYAQFLSRNSSTDGLGDGLVRLHSEILLVRLPVPDFSMPFNALCLVCSVVAVLFGSIQRTSTTVLTPVIAAGGEDYVDRPPIVRLIHRIRGLFKRQQQQHHHQQHTKTD